MADEKDRKDAQESANFEEVPAWAAGLMQTVKDLSSRVDEMSVKSKGGVPSDEEERTAVAKDSSESAESADNGPEAARLFGREEEKEEEGQADYRGMGQSPVTATEEDFRKIERSRDAGPESREIDRDLEDGVINLNTQGQERSDMDPTLSASRGDRRDLRERDDRSREDLRGHGKDKDEHHRSDAMFKKHQQEITELKSMLGRLSKQPSVDERNAIATARKRADSVYSALGRDTPEWLPGESPKSYRRRLADCLKQYSDAMKKTIVDALPDDVFDLTEERIYADALEAMKRPDIMPPLTLRPHRYQDESGRYITEYFGDPLAWMKDFMSPGQVSRINRNPGQNR